MATEAVRYDGTATPGRSILEQLWDELDVAYARTKMPQIKHRHITKGVAVGLARAISIMINPYNPNINAIQDEAHRRWKNAKRANRPRRPKHHDADAKSAPGPKKDSKRKGTGKGVRKLRASRRASA